VADEPEYLRLLRESRKGRKGDSGGTPAGATLSRQEQEAVRWARETAGGRELRSVRNLAGARFAVLVRLQSASGVQFLSLEGLPGREALVERVRPGASVGEEVLGAYEVRGGRPVTVSRDDHGQVVLKMGDPRPGANPVSPEKMLRKAAADAALREKNRPKGTGRDRGR
jgi:hypothetical protein